MGEFKLMEKDIISAKQELANQIADDILRLSEECGGGVLFYYKMRQYAEELKWECKNTNENNA